MRTLAIASKANDSKDPRWTEPDGPAYMDDQISCDSRFSDSDGSTLTTTPSGKRFMQACFLPSGWPDMESDGINFVIGGIILANAILIGVEADFGADGFGVVETIFLVIYTFEMIFRIRQIGCAYFADPVNWFDIFLVATGISACVIKSDSDGVAMLLRIFRLIRILRILRLFRMFSQLMVILHAFENAFTTVAWISLLVIMFDYVISVLATELIGHNSEFWGADADKIDGWFGNIGSSMCTCFVVMTLSSWTEIASTLCQVYPAFIVYTGFMLYIVIVSYTMVSLVTGIISEKLVAAQMADHQTRASEIEQEKRELKDKVITFLEAMDGDGDGFLTEAEVTQSLIGDEHFAILFAAVDIQLDSNSLAKMISVLRSSSPHDDRVAINDVADGILRFQGNASASSLFEVKHSLLELKNSFAQLKKQLDNIETKMDGGSCSESSPRK